MAKQTLSKKKIDMLAVRKERELWRRYKDAGCEESRQKLISSYQPLVYREISLLTVKATRRLDLIQEGTVGLIEAVEAFDPGRGVHFSTFARYRIKGRLLNCLGREREIGSRELYLAPEMFDNTTAGGDFDNGMENNFLMMGIEEKMDRLPAKEKAILQGIYIEDRTAGDVAADLSISTSYLYKLQKRGLRRLRALLAGSKR